MPLVDRHPPIRFRARWSSAKQMFGHGAHGGEKFAANNCAVALYEHSVAIWFNENPISAPEAESFQTSAHADETKDGKQRTLVQIMFCPGGGATTASATAVKSID